MLYSYRDERKRVKYWKKIYFNIFSRVVLNSHIIYKENVSAGCNPMSRLGYTIKVVDALSTEWLQEKNSAAGISGTKNEKIGSKSDFILRCSPEDKIRLFFKCSVCVICDNGNSLKKHY
jgi:hypothetical protein